MIGTFWPIAQRIKQRRSSCNIRTDVQTRVVSPPVEFTVTACHAQRGSGSSEINIMGRGTLPPVELDVTSLAEREVFPPVEFTVTACHAMRGSGSSEINVMERGLLPPIELDVTDLRLYASGSENVTNTAEQESNLPVEYTVTACRAVRGCGSTEINVMDGEKRGCQHLYKNKKTTSSLRVFAAHKGTMKYGAPRNYYAKRRSRRKRKKLNALQKVVQSSDHVVNLVKNSTNQPMFFSGTSTRSVPNQIPKCIVYSAITDMKVIDTINGAWMNSNSGDTVFVLIPRKNAILKLSHVNDTLQSLRAIDSSKRCAEKRGKKRVPVPESKQSNYATVGLKANRGCVGILDSWPRKLKKTDKDRIIKFMDACQEVASGWIQSDELRGIRMTRFLLQWLDMQGSGKESFLPSFSIALNTYLSLHTDDDFFYSILTLSSAYALRDDIDQYNLSAAVSNYFVFAEQGIAVALRPGDMLVFNPKYNHCLSSRTSTYENVDVYSNSLYLKSAIVGKNDNTIPLTQTEIELTQL